MTESRMTRWRPVKRSHWLSDNGEECVMTEKRKKKRSKALLVGAIIAVVWFAIVCSSFSDLLQPVETSDEWEQMGHEIGTSIGLVLQLPFLIVSFIALLLNWLAWILKSRGMAIACGVLYCVSLLLSVFNALGYIPCIVLSFVGSSKLKKHKQKKACVDP